MVRKPLAIVLFFITMVVASVISGCSSQVSPVANQGTKATDATSTAAITASKPTAEEFYKGKTISLYTSGTVGSGSDTWCRIIAKYLPEYTGAKVVVVNESAGNGLVIYNHLFSQIKADGLSICYNSVGTIWPGYMTGDASVQYDITRFKYIGGIESGNPLMNVTPNGKYKNIDDLRKVKDLKFAHSTKTATVTMANALAIDLLKLNGMIITGFNGDTGRQLALQQGDSDATVTAPDTAMLGKAKGTYLPILEIGSTLMKPGDDLPLLTNLVKADTLTDTQRRLVGSIDILSDPKTVFAPPETPKERLDFLAAAFKKVYDTPVFKDEVKKTVGVDVNAYVPGEEIAMRATILAAKKADMGLWTEILNKYTK
jgi:tripartite-type tricarboxylate transporter receptor subunit TctC